MNLCCYYCHSSLVERGDLWSCVKCPFQRFSSGSKNWNSKCVVNLWEGEVWMIAFPNINKIFCNDIKYNQIEIIDVDKNAEIFRLENYIVDLNTISPDALESKIKLWLTFQ